MTRNSHKGFGWFSADSLVLGAAVLLLSFAYFMPQVVDWRPQGFHVWRQADCLSLTQTYYDNGLDFFSPGVSQYMFNDFTTSETVGECTWLYYVVAMLWKIFGKHEWIYRVLVILIFYLGLLHLMKSLRLLRLDTFWSIVIPLFFFTSPVLVYYTNNFLTDVPSLGLALIATYHWINYLFNDKRSSLWWGVLFFTLAGLIKVTSLMLFCGFAGLWFFELLGLPLVRGRKIFYQKSPFFVAMSVVVIANAGWLLWAERYNTAHNGWFTPNSIWPVWDLSTETVKHVTTEFWDYLIFTAYDYYALWFFAACGMIVLVMLFKRSWLERLVFVMMTGGVIAYFVLFYKAFDVHDYYLIAPIILPLVYLVMAIGTIASRWPRFITSWITKSVMVIFLLYNVYYCRSYLRLRYFPPQEDISYIDNEQTRSELQRWFRWDWDRRMAALENIEPVLDSLGIGQEVPVISIPDPSFNVSLYLMNRKGWTEYEINSAEDIRKRIDNGAQYLLINDTAYITQKPFLKEFMSSPFAQHKNVFIYHLLQ